jgi:MFS family permease
VPLIAFVPTYESIGIWGAVILTVLRMIQGIGVGGEWGGSVLLAIKWFIAIAHPSASHAPAALASSAAHPRR